MQAELQADKLSSLVVLHVHLKPATVLGVPTSASPTAAPRVFDKGESETTRHPIPVWFAGRGIQRT
jgi:hypothetical protein